MTNQKNHIKRNALIAIGIAAATGYVAGILLAPKSGHEIREEIKEETEKTAKKLVTSAKKIEKTATEDIEHLLSRAEEISNAVRSLANTLKNNK